MLEIAERERSVKGEARRMWIRNCEPSITNLAITPEENQYTKHGTE